MIKPHGSDELNPLYVYDAQKRNALIEEAEGNAWFQLYFSGDGTGTFKLVDLTPAKTRWYC